MIMCVLLCYPVSIHMSQLLSTGHPISSFKTKKVCCKIPLVHTKPILKCTIIDQCTIKVY